MLKTFLAGATALAIAGGAFAYAQSSGTDGRSAGGEFQRVRHQRLSAEDISAFGDARIAGLHAGLKLTAEQEKLWPPVETALRDLAKQRSERFAARANADRPKDPVERLNLRAEAMGQRAAGLKKLADAAGPLYKSLDDGQKRRFAMLARFERAQHMRGHHGMRHHRGMRGGMMDNDGGR
jgi:hypothetical protein